MKPDATTVHDTGPYLSQRRALLGRFLSIGIVASLVAAYGGFAALAARFLYPARQRRSRWLYVAEVDRIHDGTSIRYVTPNGASVIITRQGADAVANSFSALSDVCPHLGCKVHWQSKEQRYFCPCHNGTFDPTGRGTGGPPGEQGLALPRYDLRIDNRLLFIEIAGTDLAALRASVRG